MSDERLRETCHKMLAKVGLDTKDLTEWRLICAPSRTLELLDERDALRALCARQDKTIVDLSAHQARANDVNRECIGQRDAALTLAESQKREVERLRGLLATSNELHRDAARWLRLNDREVDAQAVEARATEIRKETNHE